jgi:hypothetical protein
VKIVIKYIYRILLSRASYITRAIFEGGLLIEGGLHIEGVCRGRGAYRGRVGEEREFNTVRGGFTHRRRLSRAGYLSRTDV